MAAVQDELTDLRAQLASANAEVERLTRTYELPQRKTDALNAASAARQDRITALLLGQSVPAPLRGSARKPKVPHDPNE